MTVSVPISGEKILQQARQQVESAGISSRTGLHDPDVQEPPPLTPSTLAKTVTYADDILDNGVCLSLSLEQCVLVTYCSTIPMSSPIV